MLDWLRYDVRYALRGLGRDRAFTVVAVLSIGLGVGANSAIFSLVDQALFRRLPVRDPERLVLVDHKGTFVGKGWGSGNLLPHPFFRALKSENTVFEGLCARHPTSVHVSLDRGFPEQANAEIVSGSYFDVLGVRPAAGRLLEESDDVTPGGHPAVVVSHDYWRNRLGGRADVVGSKILVNAYPMIVVGVAAPGFRGIDFGEVPSLWIPTMMKKQATPEFDWLEDRRGRWLHVLGRLKPGITREAAAAALQPWFKARLLADTQDPSWPVVTAEERAKFLASTLVLLPAAAGRSDLRARLEQPLLVLLAATGLVLLLACLNVANLCLARAFARRGETALRLAIGASRGRVVRELLVQSAILAVLGALLGMALAPVVTSGLISFLPEAVDLSPAVNPRVFGFALLVALGTGLLFGLVPAVHAGRTPPGFTLKESTRTLAGGLGLRKALVVGQISLALLLLIGAGLFVRTLANLRTRGPGFATTNLVTFHIDPARSGHGDAESRELVRRVVEAMRALPEVESASVSTAMLLGPGSWNTGFTVEADRRLVIEDAVHCSAVGPGLFETLGTAIVAGRAFDDRDGSDAVEREFRSAIVNERLARRYFPDRSPIGARLAFGTAPNAVPDIEIVGVVKTFSYRARGLRDPEEQIFFPFFEGPMSGGQIYVRTRTPSHAAVASLRAALRGVDPALPYDDMHTIDDQLDRALQNERLLAILATAFAGLAILLAAVGLYGVTAFVVTRRTREIGIRMALGATRGAALWLVVRDTVAMVAAALAIAVPAAWGLGRLVESQLFGVRAVDGATIAAAAGLITAAALAATAVPARRATTLNPVEALRYE
jgi:putative ABC transport system permease protein